MRKDTPPNAARAQPTKRDLAVTVPAHMRALPAHVIRAELDRQRELLTRFDWLNPNFRRRLRFYVGGAMLWLPLFSWLLTPVGFTRLWLQLPLAALFGFILAATRLSGVSSILLCVAYGLIHHTVVGGLPLSVGLFASWIFTLLFWIVLGSALGSAEDLKRYDGE